MTTEMTTRFTRFSEVIRAASWALHQSAEGSHFMQDLLAGDISRERYARYIAQLHHVYTTLEEAAEAMRNEPIAAAFVRDELTRVTALQEDLRFYFGDDWASAISATDATREYCDRLRSECFAWSGGFVAHHYTRYMADLSGGQFIARAVEKAYDLEDHVGARFYVFDRIDDITAFKNDYRRRLDAAPWTTDARRRTVHEVLLAYRLNSRLLAALD